MNSTARDVSPASARAWQCPSLTGLLACIRLPPGHPHKRPGGEMSDFTEWFSFSFSYLISRLGRSPGEGNGSPLQYSCLGNPMDRGVWRATARGVVKSHGNHPWAVNATQEERRQCPVHPAVTGAPQVLWSGRGTRPALRRPWRARPSPGRGIRKWAELPCRAGRETPEFLTLSQHTARPAALPRTDNWAVTRGQEGGVSRTRKWVSAALPPRMHGFTRPAGLRQDSEELKAPAPRTLYQGESSFALPGPPAPSLAGTFLEDTTLQQRTLTKTVSGKERATKKGVGRVK